RVVVVIGDRENYHARLGSGLVAQTKPHSGVRGVLRAKNHWREDERREHHDGRDPCEARSAKPHFRNAGSKLKTTGSTSSEKPSGSGPNAIALAAASTAPCASRSNEKFPDRLMNVRSDTEPSR